MEFFNVEFMPSRVSARVQSIYPLYTMHSLGVEVRIGIRIQSPLLKMITIVV